MPWPPDSLLVLGTLLLALYLLSCLGTRAGGGIATPNNPEGISARHVRIRTEVLLARDRLPVLHRRRDRRPAPLTGAILAAPAALAATAALFGAFVMAVRGFFGWWDIEGHGIFEPEAHRMARLDRMIARFESEAACLRAERLSRARG